MAMKWTRKAPDEKDHDCFTGCLFNKEYNCTCISFCSERTRSKEDALEKLKPIIIYEETILSDYQRFIDRAENDLMELQGLNNLFKGKYESHIETEKKRLRHYQFLYNEAWNDIDARFRIMRRDDL